MIVLCGAPGTGKSTLATRIAVRLDITRVVTSDAIRDVLRTVVPKRSLPELHRSTFELVVPDSPEPFSGFDRQCNAVGSAAVAIADRLADEHRSLILEGVHMLPGATALVAGRSPSRPHRRRAAHPARRCRSPRRPPPQAPGDRTTATRQSAPRRVRTNPLDSRSPDRRREPIRGRSRRQRRRRATSPRTSSKRSFDDSITHERPANHRARRSRGGVQQPPARFIDEIGEVHRCRNPRHPPPMAHRTQSRILGGATQRRRDVGAPRTRMRRDTTAPRPRDSGTPSARSVRSSSSTPVRSGCCRITAPTG